LLSVAAPGKRRKKEKKSKKQGPRKTRKRIVLSCEFKAEKVCVVIAVCFLKWMSCKREE
jgi:hypothetical protein